MRAGCINIANKRGKLDSFDSVFLVIHTYVEIHTMYLGGDIVIWMDLGFGNPGPQRQEPHRCVQEVLTHFIL